MSAPSGLPGIMVSIVLGVIFVPTILTWQKEGNYLWIVLVILGLVLFIFILWYWEKIINYFWKN